MKRKPLLTFLALIITLPFLVTACLPWQEKEEPPKLHLVVPESQALKILNLPLYVAIENDYFKEQGLEFSLTYATSNEEALKQLKSGKAEAIFLGSEKLILEKKDKEGTNLKVFTHSFRGLGTHLLTREVKEPFQWSQVKDASIVAHHFDNLSQMTLEHELRNQELIPQENVVLFRSLPYYLMPGAFKSGSGAYLYTFEPTATQFEAEGIGKVVVSFGPDVIDFPLQSYVSTKNVLEKDALAMQQFVNGLYKAQLWINKYPIKEVSKTVNTHYKDIEDELLLTIINRYKDQGFWKAEPVPTQKSLVSLQEVMLAGGSIHEKLPSDDLVYTKFAVKAVESVVLPDEEKKTFWDKTKDFFKFGK